MTTVGEIVKSSANGTCGTASVRKLSLQIIAEMNIIVPNVLVSLDSLNVKAESTSVNLYSQPGAKDALRRVISAKGNQLLTISSAYRTVAQQYLLFSWFKNRACGISLAARPGKSNHEDGMAIDVPDPANATWRSELEAENWDWLGANDRFHFTYRGGGRGDIGEIGVKAFQQLWNRYHPNDRLPVDGDFGLQTAARMNMTPADGFPSPRILKLSTPPMKGDDVLRVQRALVHASLLRAGDLTGVYDVRTAEAVGSFQQIRGLGADKVVGLVTRRELGVPNV
jgi:D-alanyl-D-alanine carboxypeptidase/Putative peptidoglycan binding domain